MVAGGYLEGPLKDGNLTFKNVMLKSGAKKVTFTAYAFNSERIKSETASLDYEPPATVAAAAGKPRAYLLQIGVNHVQAEGCELQYSGNDAEKMSAVLKTRLEAQGMAVEPVVLESQMCIRDRDAAMHRLEAVADVGQRAPDDDRHGVVEVGAPHLLLYIDGGHDERAGAGGGRWAVATCAAGRRVIGVGVLRRGGLEREFGVLIVCHAASILAVLMRV